MFIETKKDFILFLLDSAITYHRFGNISDTAYGIRFIENLGFHYEDELSEDQKILYWIEVLKQNFDLDSVDFLNEFFEYEGHGWKALPITKENINEVLETLENKVISDLLVKEETKEKCMNEIERLILGD